MKTHRIATIALASVLFILFPFSGLGIISSGVAVAQEPGDGGRARINVAGRLPILAETMAAAACMLDEGFDIDHERQVLKEAHDDFIRMIDALQHGEPRVGIPTPENHRKTLTEIEELRSFWAPMDSAVMAFLTDKPTHEQAEIIAKQNRAVVAQSEIVFSVILNEYTNPFEMLLSDAVAVSFAERQEVFAEKLKREACEIGSGHGNDAIYEDFDNTMQLFESTMTALHDGYPTVGIKPPPNQIIVKHLEEAMVEWEKAKPLLLAVRASGGATEDEMVEIRKVTEGLDHTMHAIVVEYLLASPGANDMIDAPLRDYATRELTKWLNDPVIIDAIRAHNIETENMTPEELAAQNQQWTRELNAGSGPLIDKVLNNPASAILKEMKAATSDIVTEVFVMDLRGANVAESEPTINYWHLEEERYQAIARDSDDKIYVSDVHLEVGGDIYQAEVSLPINDPETGERIGVASFGVNVQSMF